MQIVLLILIALTGIISYLAWQKPEYLYKFQFNAYQVRHRRQWYRLITHAFLHGGWTHLIINMLVLYSFGRNVLYIFGEEFPNKATAFFLLLYFSAIVFSSLYSLARHSNDSSYNAIGASGAVSAVVFTSIFFQPWHLLYFFGIIPIPGIVFGGLYLAYSWYMSKRNTDMIGHDAHFWGAVYGFAFPVMLEPNLIRLFIDQLMRI